MSTDVDKRKPSWLSLGLHRECRLFRQGYSMNPRTRGYPMDELCSCDKGYPLVGEAVWNCKATGYFGPCWMREDVHYQHLYTSLLAWKGFFRKESLPRPA